MKVNIKSLVALIVGVVVGVGGVVATDATKVACDQFAAGPLVLNDKALAPNE